MRVEKVPKIVMTKTEYDVVSEFAKVLSNYCEHDVVFCKDCSIYEWCHDSSSEPQANWHARNGSSWSELLNELRCQDVLMITDEPNANWHASSGDAQILNKPKLDEPEKNSCKVSKANIESLVNNKYFFNNE